MKDLVVGKLLLLNKAKPSVCSIAVVGLAVAPCIEQYDLSGGSGGHLGSSFDTVVRRARNFWLCADLFASLIDDRISSALPGRSCYPLCLGPGLHIRLIICMNRSGSKS